MSVSEHGPTLQWVRKSYNDLSTTAVPIDPWHVHTHQQLEQFVAAHVSGLPADAVVLNAGSGGKNLGLTNTRHVHVDVAEKTLKTVPCAINADVQALPFRDSWIDVGLCIGCVINYCDAVACVSELARTMKPGARLLLDYERARSWEYMGTPIFRSSVHPVQTFYRDTTQYLWVYSDEYVKNVLSAAGLRILAQHWFHILSPLALRVTGSGASAAAVARFDRALRYVPGLRGLASHVICLCEKTASDP